MDPKQIAKQMIDFNKKAFENSFSAMCTLQDQAEKVFTALMEQPSPWFPKELNKLTAEWIKAYKKGRDQFKADADENFKKIEEYFSDSEGGKTKSSK
jgi:hypothetical protein